MQRSPNGHIQQPVLKKARTTNSFRNIVLINVCKFTWYCKITIEINIVAISNLRNVFCSRPGERAGVVARDHVQRRVVEVASLGEHHTHQRVRFRN